MNNDEKELTPSVEHEDKSYEDFFDFGDGPVPAHRHPNGGGWVADTAHVDHIAYVGPDAWVFDKALIYGNSRICDKARVSGNAVVWGSVWICDKAKVSENATVRDSAQVFGSARVFGDAFVFGGALVCGNALVRGTSRVLGKARVQGDALVCGGRWLKSPLYIEGSRHSITMCAPGSLAIGCQVRSINHWLACGKEIGERHDYTQAELEEYERYIRLAAEMYTEDAKLERVKQEENKDE